MGAPAWHQSRCCPRGSETTPRADVRPPAVVLVEGEAPHELKAGEGDAALAQRTDCVEREVDGLPRRVVDGHVGVTHRDVEDAVHEEVENLVVRVQQPSELVELGTTADNMGTRVHPQPPRANTAVQFNEKKEIFNDMMSVKGKSLMENVIYNELLSRGYNVDVGVPDKYGKRAEGKSELHRLEVDFVATLGSARYYVQSALGVDDPAEREQETRSLLGVPDSFRKIVVVQGAMRPRCDKDGRRARRTLRVPAGGRGGRPQECPRALPSPAQIPGRYPHAPGMRWRISPEADPCPRPRSGRSEGQRFVGQSRAFAVRKLILQRVHSKRAGRLKLRPAL